MLIVPAIDLINGGCVRLRQGEFGRVTEYGDPAQRLAAFADAGASLVHVVDLDGARAGRPVQTDIVAKLARIGPPIQCGGGVRARADIEALLDAGVSRVVIGSLAARDPEKVSGWIAEFGADRICAAFDVRDGEVAAEGWTEQAGVTLADALDRYPLGSLRHALVTDIARDGELSGPNVDLIRGIVRLRSDIQVQASGGVAALADLDSLRAAGAAGAIVGRALYDGAFTLEDAIGR